MSRAMRASLFGLWLAAPAAVVAQPAAAPAGPTAVDLAGAWAGSLTHEEETTPLALELEPAADGKMIIKATIPAVRLTRQPIAREALQVQGQEVRVGPFTFRFDQAAGTLSGVMPEGLVPVYRIPFVLRRAVSAALPVPPGPRAPLVQPAWTYEAGSPLWAGATFADGLVFAGGEDGRLHALDAVTGKARWSFQTGGAVRTRATVSRGSLYVQADDGVLYGLAAATGKERWRLRLGDKPIERLPFDNPRSRYDRFGSGVAVAAGRLYVGTHDGRLVAIDPARGAKLWEFAAGDSVLAAPAVDSGRLYFGSFDKHVYALDAASGQLLWKRDTQGAVVSTPAVAGNRLVIGNRCYDLLGLDTKTGEVAWKRYLWFTWVESSATVRDGVAYVGSSDPARVYAFDAQTGAPRWSTDAFGWAWGQPAVTAGRVYAGTSSQVGYPAQHRAGALALDRATGQPLWRYAATAPVSGAFGFPGSPAVGAGLVFLTGLDGRVYAFKQ